MKRIYLVATLFLVLCSFVDVRSEIYMDVDAGITVSVNKVPLVDNVTSTTIDETIAYNETNMDLNWNFVTTAGVITQTNVVPTTAGDYDWTHVGNGMYKIEMTASGGASANNNTEGFGWFTGLCDGVLPWSGPVVTFRSVALNNSLIDGGDFLQTDPVELGGDAQSLTDLKDFADAGYDPTTDKVQGVVLVDTTTTNSDMVGEPSAAIVTYKLDHLVFAADGDDPANDSIIAKLASKAVPADWSTHVNATDSQEAIRDALVDSNPQNHPATANNETTGTLDAGTFADTETVNVTYYQTSPVTPAVGGFGLNVDLTFNIGIGRVPSNVIVTGYFDAGAQRTVQSWAYNYITAAFVQLSNSANDFGNAASNQTFEYAMTLNMVQASDGEVKIRFTSESTTVADDWFCDYVNVTSVAQEAAGLTADAIQQAVWARDDFGHDEHTLGYVLSLMRLAHGQIVSATDATKFIIASDHGDPLSATDISYPGQIIILEDKTDDHYEIRRIIAYTGSTKEITVDRAFGFTPAALDDWYLMGTGYADVNATHVSGTAQTANDNGADINEILIDTGTTIPGLIATAQSDLDAITGADGTTLATSQPNYAPNVVIPDVAGTAPTSTEIWQENVSAFAGAGQAGTYLKSLFDNQGDWLTAVGFPTAVQNRQEMDSNSTELAKIGTIPALDGAGQTIGAAIGKLADDNGGADYDATAHSLKALRDRGDAAWTTGGGGAVSDILNVQALIPKIIDLANTSTVRLALGLTNMLDDLPTTGEITPGTISIDRKAIGGTSWVSIVSNSACSELAGLIYYDEVFDTGAGYAEGDSIRITFKNQKITVAANDYEITDATGWIFQTGIGQTMVGTDSANTVVPDPAGTGPTTAQLNARTLVSADYFAPGSDSVTVGTNNDKTGYALSAAGVDDIWDELLTAATHNIATSAGRRLRDIASDVILTGTSPDSGGTANTAIRIELDGDASSMDGAYDPANLAITGGTGEGQSRQVFEYDGTNKYAYINRSWKVIPDSSSEYTISGSSGNTHVNEGLVTGGSNNTITLNALAESGDNIYRGQTVFLFAGTGQDQQRTIIAYNGTSRVATVDRDWVTNPVDGETIYAVLPTADVTNIDLPNQTMDIVGTISTVTNLTNNDDKTDYSLGVAGVDAIIDAYLAKTYEGTETLGQHHRLVRSVLMGESGGSAGTVNFRDKDDTKDRVTATMSSGRRTSVTINDAD